MESTSVRWVTYMGGDLITPGGVGPWGYEYEVWVPVKDEAQARKALGL